MILKSWYLGLVFFLLSMTSWAEESSWPDYPISNFNVVTFLGETLSSGSAITSPEVQVCPELKLSQLCSEARMKSLEDLNNQHKEMTKKWLEEVEAELKRDNVKERCTSKSQSTEKKFEDAKKSFDKILEIYKSNPSQLSAELEKEFSLNSKDVKENLVHWRKVCKGEVNPMASSTTEYLFLMWINAKNTKSAEAGKKFCKDLITSDEEWFKKEVIKKSSDYLKDFLKGSTTNYLISRNFKDSYFGNNFQNQDPYHFSISKEKIKDLKSNLYGKNCSQYSLTEDLEDQVCYCLDFEINDLISKKVNRDYESKLKKAEQKIADIYVEMIQKSNLKPEEKESLLTKYPSPKLRTHLSSSALGGLSYSFDELYLPFKERINISPKVLDAFLLSSDSELSELAQSVVTHEIGHHFFTSLMGKDKMHEDLGSESQKKLKEFSDCVDGVTYSREMIPAFRNEIETEVEYIEEAVPEKRAELAADLYSIAFNKINSLGISWKSENSTLFSCLMTKKLSNRESIKDMFEDSHTSPEARVDVLINPPKCGDILWK